ncbi:heat-shock protein [Methanosarcina sp. 2.H.T.1A.6]|jgi:HSP20 family protein|uniref:Hsp20/alpha crystallin family protein n=1 Tax=unclassified Methanosarcina TaxID=2644672 RepID=UPI000622092A|nr:MULTISPECIES: Hsp20/alpha crystallin family protein [unclassified Methanosarcina]KKG08623.1 heat-shock protein [Methanosarcina sp. 2.H.A.1B.4]KKG14481.1 heat-shock protein [Methanosarcina sp. 2.H.T.1A.3]KKG18642.1 heat-shock protein [Methanosarcina sp. 2.H.T.1A.15]KKG24267.1 heat-shock protein [Methanosarcina sp. 2.H.T.1A.8]KKG24920.1 heat-shock protein [Methanosarcina sp. 2.H.T.1A.6]
MVGIRKRKDFFEDFGSELFDNLEEMIEALLEEMGESVPFVYGFSIIHRPGEDTELREFGNVPEYSQKEENFFASETKEPLIDIFENEDMVHVLAEFPEVEKKDLLLHATAQHLEIKVIGLSEYSEDVELPVLVDPKSAKASYKNGVLEVTFRRCPEESPVAIEIN